MIFAITEKGETIMQNKNIITKTQRCLPLSKREVSHRGHGEHRELSPCPLCPLWDIIIKEKVNAAILAFILLALVLMIPGYVSAQNKLDIINNSPVDLTLFAGNVNTGFVIGKVGALGSQQVDITNVIDDAMTAFFYASNDSPFILELRLGDPNGEKIAALAPGERNKKIWLKPNKSGMPYQIFYQHALQKFNEQKEWIRVSRPNNSYRVEPNAYDARVIEFPYSLQELGPRSLEGTVELLFESR
jgi:hypothetical protein